MWNSNSRETIWDQLNQTWDVIIIGGGITGAGVLREAVNLGLKSLLIEAHDFSFGTSSRSSKLVHGGFRYLRNRQIDVTRESVREREWLLKSAPHLVDKLSFLIPEWKNSKTPAWQYMVGVVIYDLLAPKWEHRRLTPAQMLALAPTLRREGLTGGCQYYDAVVDDSSLVVRILREAVQHGGIALNYARVDGLLRDQLGNVRGVRVIDTSGQTKNEIEIQSRAVINATGPWSDDLRAHVGAKPRLRKCRGSHLVFPKNKFPLRSAVTLMHPEDNRYMFAIPWEGTTIIGTTDIDHPVDWGPIEPFATHEEIQYILAALYTIFPSAEVTGNDIISTFAGLRPLIRPETQTDPSAVSRRHVVWDENGLVTITGGKLTTFRIMARDALQAVLSHLNSHDKPDDNRPIFTPPPTIDSVSKIDPFSLLHLTGRFGTETESILAYAQDDELDPIENLPNIWAELRWAARSGAVVHLEDLLLRRVRLGLLLPRGGLDHIQRIRKIVQPELGWDDHHWNTEVNAYQATWQRFYAPTPTGIEPASELCIPASNTLQLYSSIKS